MRHEHDTERDVMRIVYSDAPAVNTTEYTMNGARHVFGIGSDGQPVYTEIHDFSKVVEQMNQTVRRTIHADPQARDPVGTLKWRIRDVEADREIGAGVKNVVLGECTIDSIEGPSTKLTNKQFLLADDFSLGLASNYSTEPEISGFALKGDRSDVKCFSWDWFDVESLWHARKLQEGGELRFFATKTGDSVEIVETEFLTDVSIRISRFGSEDPTKDVAWRIEIEKGSYLRWPYELDGRVVI